MRQIAFVVISACVFTTGHTQEPNAGQTETWQFEYDLFQMLLEERGLQVTTSYEEALANPGESVIVIVGTLPPRFSIGNRDWANLVSFIRSGGTALLASDSDFQGSGFGRFFQGPVTSNSPQDQYQGFQDCLQVSPRNTNRMPGVASIVVNRSGWFVPAQVSWLNWQAWANFSDTCEPSQARGQQLLAVGSSSDRNSGSVIVSGDASLFTNGMMWHGDNAVAAIRVSELLCQNGKRKLAFMSNRRLLSTYRDRISESPSESANAPEIPEPTLDKILRLSNAVLKEIASSNVLNEALRQQPRHWKPATYFLLLLNIFVVVFLAFLAWLLWHGGYLKSFFLAQRKMQTAYELRCNTGGNRGDYRNAAGYLAREFCWEATGSRRSADWEGSLKRTRKLSRGDHKRLLNIVDIACRGQQTRLGRVEFEQLGKTIIELSEKLTSTSQKASQKGKLASG